MIWSVSTPGESATNDWPASQVDAQYHNTKIMLRERFEITDSLSIKEHGDPSDVILGGIHQASKTGFVNISTNAGRIISGLVEGSLHYVTDAPIGLSLVDSTITFKRIGSMEHAFFSNLLDPTAHLQYLLKDDSVLARAMTGVLTLGASGTFTIVSPTSNNDETLPTGHVSTVWSTAHGNYTANDRLFAINSVIAGNLFIGSGVVTTSQLNLYSGYFLFTPVYSSTRAFADFDEMWIRTNTLITTRGLSLSYRVQDF